MYIVENLTLGYTAENAQNLKGRAIDREMVFS
jgi:hypothetical protein